MQPMAWGALRPRDSKVEPAVHAVVLILLGALVPIDCLLHGMQLADLPADDPVSSETLPCPCPPVLWYGDEVAVAPESIPIVGILIDRALELLGPIPETRFAFGSHRQGMLESEPGSSFGGFGRTVCLYQAAMLAASADKESQHAGELHHTR